MIGRGKLLIAFSLAIVLMGCAQDVNAEQTVDTNKAATAVQSLEATCAQLGEEQAHKYKYKVMTGFVIRGGKLLPTGDCFYGSCKDEDSKMASFYAGMIHEPLKKPHSWMDTPEEFRVYTKSEMVGSLKSKVPYFEINKSYRFCAREIDNKLAPSPKVKFYQVDSADNIQEIK